MKVLVTGSSGFVGTHLVDRLRSGNYFVRAVDIKPPRESVMNSEEHTWLRDIRDSAIAKVFQGVDTVVHCAAMIDETMCLADITKAIDVNITGTVNLLENCVMDGVKRFIFISSAAVYGNNISTVIESTPLMPTTIYGSTKLMAEYFVKNFSRRTGLETIILRPFNIYGPGMNFTREPLSVIARFILNAINDKPLPIYGDGKNTRDFVFIEDVIEAIFCALHTENEKVANSTFNVATGISMDMLNLTKMIGNKIGKKVEIEYLPERHDEVKHSVGNPSYAMRVLGVTLPEKLVDGIEKTIDWAFEKNY